eukprot:358613_1
MAAPLSFEHPADDDMHVNALKRKLNPVDEQPKAKRQRLEPPPTETENDSEEEELSIAQISTGTVSKLADTKAPNKNESDPKKPENITNTIKQFLKQTAKSLTDCVKGW